MTNRNEDLSRRDADIAVRMIRPTQNAVVARRIGESKFGLYAHRAYLKAFGTPLTLDDPKAHKLIGYDQDDRAFRGVGALADQLSRETFGFRSESPPNSDLASKNENEGA